VESGRHCDTLLARFIPGRVLDLQGITASVAERGDQLAIDINDCDIIPGAHEERNDQPSPKAAGTEMDGLHGVHPNRRKSGEQGVVSAWGFPGFRVRGVGKEPAKLTHLESNVKVIMV